jgi:hypothetical protein
MDAPALIDRLRAHADVFTALSAWVGAEQARWKPEPAQWSILEVVNHLGDEEVEDFRTRLDCTLHRKGEPWPKIDPQGWAVARGYNQRDLAESLERFCRARADSLDWLVALGQPDWSVAYEHPRFGPITAGDLLTAWVAHDHIHIRQINRLHRQYLVSVLSGHSPDYAGSW